MKKVFELDFEGRKIVVEAGEIAKQTAAAVLVRYGETVVLSNCVMSNHTVDWISFLSPSNIKKECMLLVKSQVHS